MRERLTNVGAPAIVMNVPRRHPLLAFLAISLSIIYVHGRLPRTLFMLHLFPMIPERFW
jgi:hypothetical protein